MRNLKHFFLAYVILALLLALPNMITVSGAVITKLYVDPYLSVAMVGEDFNVTVIVENVQDLFSWQVVLSFDPTILEVIDVTIGEILATQPQGTYEPPPVLNNTHGWTGFGELTLGRQPGVDGTGILATVTFNVKGTGESFLNITDPVPIGASANATTVLLDSSWPTPQDIFFTTEDGTFITGAKPVPLFTHSPSSPEANETITFDASSSYDPDGIITQHFWDFDDGTNATGAIVQHAFTLGGTYSVALTVKDNSTVGLEGVLEKDIIIRFGDDVAVMSVTATPKTVKAGETVSINVTAMNQGLEAQTFDVTVYYSPTAGTEDHIAGTLAFTELAPGATKSSILEWDTSEVDLGDYRIKAVASTVEGETDTADNTFVDGTVTVEVSESGFPLEYVIVGVVAVAVIIGVAFLYMRRKGS